MAKLNFNVASNPHSKRASSRPPAGKKGSKSMAKTAAKKKSNGGPKSKANGKMQKHRAKHRKPDRHRRNFSEVRRTW